MVGALSAGRTLLGPVNLVLSTAATLGSCRSWPEPGPRLSVVRTRAAIRFALLVAAAVLPLTVAVALLPDAVGKESLGANWTVAGACWCCSRWRVCSPCRPPSVSPGCESSRRVGGRSCSRPARRAPRSGGRRWGGPVRPAPGAAGALVVLALGGGRLGGSYLLLLAGPGGGPCAGGPAGLTRTRGPPRPAPTGSARAGGRSG